MNQLLEKIDACLAAPLRQQGRHPGSILKTEFQLLIEARDRLRELEQQNECKEPDSITIGFAHNPNHPIGTCCTCGEEMIYNAPRLGPDGGYVHKSTSGFICSPKEVLAGGGA